MFKQMMDTLYNQYPVMHRVMREFEQDEIDQIVVAELKQDVIRAISKYPNPQLVDSLCDVLMYYMDTDDFNLWYDAVVVPLIDEGAQNGSE